MGFNAKRILQSRNPWFPIEATGGTISLLISSNPAGDSIPYRVHTFSTTGVNTFTVNRPGTSPFVEYLIVGGGGSGGWGGGGSNQLRGGGGGGAGGVITNINMEGFRINQTSYYVNVGAGGKPKTSPATAADLTSTSGQRSTIFGLTAEGGGAGGGRVGFSTASPFTQYHGKAGGSGGGAGANATATATSFPSGGSSTLNQGFSGGSTAGYPISNANITGSGTPNPSFGGAGGGGYSQRGTRNIYNSTLFYGGSGGDGLFTRIRVLSGEWFAGGGGGGAGTNSISYSLLSARGIQGQGSLGAGGFSFTNSFSGRDGVLIGSGGGGQAGNSSLTLTTAVAEANKPGSGGPGIVIVRYPLLSRSFVPMSVTATGSVTTTDTTINGVLYRIHTYTGNGNFIVNSINNSKGLIKYFMIGGGGGGAWGDSSGYAGAGGGAGGYITNEAATNLVIGVNDYPIIVGNGGNFLNNTGGNTIAFDLTALGGGLGSNSFNPAQTGGSGGGGGMAGSLYPNPGLGTATQGFNGGFGEFGAAGGGGGAAGTGISYVGAYLAGDGGPGYTSYLRNTTGEIFGAGGGGGTIAPDNNFIGIGGSGIGGNGGSGVGSATNPAPNTGSGGGGGGPLGGNNFGTVGAAGIAIIRYPLVYTTDVLDL